MVLTAFPPGKTVRIPVPDFVNSMQTERSLSFDPGCPFGVTKQFCVGNVLIDSEVGGIALQLPTAFCVSGHRSPDIQIGVNSAPEIQPIGTTIAFHSGALWTLFRDHQQLTFDFTSPVLGPTPYKRMQVSEDFTRVQIIVTEDVLGRHGSLSPLEYPADELLITNYLAFHGIGTEMHGCGFVDRDAGGQLFLGHSGAGKSTTMRVWEYFRNPEILSDDRIILRIHDGELWMYGTPWHGEAEFASPGRAKLGRIFILQHGRENSIKPLTKCQALGEMFARCFPPFHSHVGIERTLEFLKRVLDIVSVYRFEFVPDKTSVDAVLSFHG